MEFPKHQAPKKVSCKVNAQGEFYPSRWIGHGSNASFPFTWSTSFLSTQVPPHLFPSWQPPWWTKKPAPTWWLWLKRYPFFGFKHSTTIPQLEMKYPSNWMVHQNWPSKNMYPGAFMASHDCDLKTSLKYVAVLALHRRGWLDRYNGVPRKVIAGAQAWQKSIGAAEEFECSLDFGVGKSFWEWKLRDFDDVWEVRHHWKLFLFWMDSFFW